MIYDMAQAYNNACNRAKPCTLVTMDYVGNNQLFKFYIAGVLDPVQVTWTLGPPDNDAIAAAAIAQL